MRNVLKLITAFGFIVICGYILSTSTSTTVADVPETTPVIVEPAPQEVIQEEAPIELTTPIQLSIESIGVEAPIELVGVLNGAMAVPTLPENVGWYEFGTRPGDVGSAILAGHVNWKDSPNAAFTNLKNVQIGDMIKITNSDGELVYFFVSEIKSYPFYADTTEVFSSNDGLARLNLITCGGLWNSVIKSHESRLVIFAIKISPQ